MKNLFFLYLILSIVACKKETINKTENQLAVTNQEGFPKKITKKNHQIREIKKAIIVPKLDGSIDDPIWKEVIWYGLDQKWLGDDYTVDDFFGRYKIVWTPEAIYILVEIKDNKLYDQNKNPLTLWWNDDCVDIFIDADNSGGNHQFSNNAFAYHVALDGNVVDIGKDEKPLLYNNHVTAKRMTKGDVSVWEFEMIVYDDTYEEGKVNDPVILKKDQQLGFAIAYSDNDDSKKRENFIGSVFIPGEEKDLGWINADVFGTILLVE